MAIWEIPGALSGDAKAGQPAVQPYVGVCIIHTSEVSSEWAFHFRHLNFGYPYIFFHASNMPYDCSRELITRECLKNKVKWVFSLDTDVLMPTDGLVQLIQLAEANNLPVLSGVYWAKKREPIPIPCAWVKTGYNAELNQPQYAAFDIKPYMDKNALIAVDVVGAGCLLVRADVFEKLDQSNPNLPFFQWGLNRKDPQGKPLLQTSEDFALCERIKNELNLPIHVSTLVKCGHICRCQKKPDDGTLELI